MNWVTVHHGRIAMVQLAGRWTDPNGELVGTNIEIDGDTYLCRAVDTYMHAPPFGNGETVSILVGDVIKVSPQVAQEGRTRRAIASASR